MQKDANGLKNFRKTFEKIIDNREEYDIITTVFLKKTLLRANRKRGFSFNQKRNIKRT
jgi:hypothetical protein